MERDLVEGGRRAMGAAPPLTAANSKARNSMGWQGVNDDGEMGGQDKRDVRLIYLVVGGWSLMIGGGGMAMSAVVVRFRGCSGKIEVGWVGSVRSPTRRRRRGREVAGCGCSKCKCKCKCECECEGRRGLGLNVRVVKPNV